MRRRQWWAQSNFVKRLSCNLQFLRGCVQEKFWHFSAAMLRRTEAPWRSNSGSIAAILTGPRMASLVSSPSLREQLAVLAEWLDTGVDPGPDAWVFASETRDTPLWRDNLLRRHIRPHLEALEPSLGWVDFKVMRRTNASLGHSAKDRKSTR